MDSTALSSATTTAAAAESSTAASVAATSAPTAPESVVQPEKPEQTSSAPAEQGPSTLPPPVSTEVANADVASSADQAPAPTDLTDEPSVAASPPPQPIVERGEAAVEMNATVSPPQTEQAAAPAALPSDDSTAPSQSTVDSGSAQYPQQPEPMASVQEASDAASATEPVIAAASLNAPQDVQPEAKPTSAAAIPLTGEPVASFSAPRSIFPAPSPAAALQTPGDVVATDKHAEDVAKPQSSSAPEQSMVIEAEDSEPATSIAASQPGSTTMESAFPPAVAPQAAAAADSEASETAATRANTAPELPPQLESQASDATQVNKAVDEPSKQDDAAAEEKSKTNESTPTVSDQPKEGQTQVDEPAVAASSSSVENVAAAHAAEAAPAPQASTNAAPATPDKKAPMDGASAADSSTSMPSTPAREGRVALVLRINKELIRLCVEMQSKQLTMDPIYREAAVRLQANLGYLASIADRAGKSVDPTGRASVSGALPRLEPFPRSEHAPSSPLPALFDKLIALFGAAKQSGSPLAEGKKRSRDSPADLSADDPRKRAASKGIDQSQSQDVSAAATPSSTSNQQQPAETPASAAAASSDLAPSSTSAGQQNQPPPASAPQAAQQASQQPGKGPDLSLAPPVPNAPPAAAQNIPNNPQAQALMQAFGPNALVNLHALQSHLRGQGTHPWVAFMEANVSGFKAMPLQVQLQHMTSLQNAALQRQKGLGGQGPTGPGSGVGSPATMPNGGPGSTSSPATTRPASRHSNSPSQAQASPSASTFAGAAPGRTGTPLGGGPGALQKRPGSSGSVGSMTSAGGRNRTGSSNFAFDPSQLQSAPSPATMNSMGDFASQPQFGFQPPGLQQGSPAASAASPGQQQQHQQPQPQGAQPAMGMGMGMGGMPNFQNLPPHLQQQIRQQYMAHMQAQAQAQGASFNPQQQQQQQQQQQPQQQPQQQAWNFQPPQ